MTLAIPLVLIVLAGILEGLFSLPVARTRRWQFENIWFAGSAFALALVPWPLALATVPDLAAVYRSVPWWVLAAVVASGVAWGVGGIFWGRAIDSLGMALGVSLLMGLINVFGSIGPLAVFKPQKLLTPGGLALIGALAVMILGVIVVALAGSRRAAEQAGGAAAAAPPRFWLGLGFCLLSGILSAGVNFGFVAGSPLAAVAETVGTPGFARSFPIWCLVFTANYLVNAVYGLAVMLRRGTLHLLWTAGSVAAWAGALFMGLAWPGGIVLYGIGAGGLGAYGAYAGFPMMILISILAGNAAGALGGEWLGTSRSSRLIMILGVGILFAAFALLGLSNHLLAST